MNIPPSKGLFYSPEVGRYREFELIENIRKKGQLEGVEMDVDEGVWNKH